MYGRLPCLAHFCAVIGSGVLALPYAVAVMGW